MIPHTTKTLLCLLTGVASFAFGQAPVPSVQGKPVEAGNSSSRVGQQTMHAPGTVSPIGSQPAAPANPLATTSTSAPVTLGSGDLLTISVYDTPEMTAQVRVNSDGIVTFPPIGEVRVGGLTPEQAGESIRDKLVSGEFVNQPHVSVFVQEYASQAVYVTGEVAHPGVYPLLGSYRLLDILSAAGGITPLGGDSISITHRADPDSPETVQLNSKSASTGGNPVMAPGDTVYVPQAGVVYVVGEVTHPGGFLLDRDSTLTAIQAIALAQGTTQIAAMSRARIVRSNEDGKKEMIFLDLKKVYDAKMPDLQLKKNDILYVPPSTVRIFTSQAFLQAALAAAAGASVYRW
jgi:polysaccharide export outer membrane protein